MRRNNNPAPGSSGGFFGFGRKNRDDDDLMNGGVPVGALGTELPMAERENAANAPTGRFSDTTPFKDALDQYHQHQPVNQSSNF